MSTLFIPGTQVNAARPLVVFHGDSLLTTPDTANSIPGQMATALTGYDIISHALAAQRIDEATALYPTQGARHYSASRSKNILVISGGGMDIMAADSTATVLSDIAALYAAGVATGYHVIVCTLPANNAFNASNETKRLEVNTGLRAAYGSANLADLAADSRFDLPADTSDTTYYSDGSHPTTAGAAILMGIIRTKVEQARITGATLGDMGGQLSTNVNIRGGRGLFGVLRIQAFNKTDQASFATSGLQFVRADGTLESGIFQYENAGSPGVYKLPVSGVFWIVDNTGGSVVFAFSVDGTFTTEKITVGRTVTAAGTTGAVTINRPSGTVNFAAGATTVVVTNSLCTVNTIVMAVVRTNDATAEIKNVIPAAGSFTIRLSAAATAETSVGFFFAV